MLTTEHIKKTVSDYFRDKPVKKVYLFGSYARGEANENSDVDLSVVLSDTGGVDYMTLAGYLLDLQGSLKKRIDLVEEKMIYLQIKPFFKDFDFG